MSLRFSRRVSILPGVRLNFSRSGVSATIGVRGASVTLGGPGGAHANLGIPGSGLSARIPLGGASRPEPRREDPPSGAGLAPLPPETPAPARAMRAAPQMAAVASAGIDRLTSPELTELRDLIMRTRAQRETADLAYAEAGRQLSAAATALAGATAARDRAASFRDRLERSWLRALRGRARRRAETALDAAEEALADADDEAARRTAARDQADARRGAIFLDTEFVLEQPAERAWAELDSAFGELSQSVAIWDITSFRTKIESHERTRANRMIERKAVQLAYAELPMIASRYRALRWQNANGGDLYLYPGMAVMAFSDTRFALIDLRTLSLGIAGVEMNEHEPAPSDAAQIGTTWTYSNRDGAPDRRFADNPSVPILLYARARRAADRPAGALGNAGHPVAARSPASCRPGEPGLMDAQAASLVLVLYGGALIVAILIAHFPVFMLTIASAVLFGSGAGTLLFGSALREIEGFLMLLGGLAAAGSAGAILAVRALIERLPAAIAAEIVGQSAGARSGRASSGPPPAVQ